jgi:hypothetical protein
MVCEVVKLATNRPTRLTNDFPSPSAQASDLKENCGMICSLEAIVTTRYSLGSFTLFVGRFGCLEARERNPLAGRTAFRLVEP